MSRIVVLACVFVLSAVLQAHPSNGDDEPVCPSSCTGSAVASYCEHFRDEGGAMSVVRCNISSISRSGSFACSCNGGLAEMTVTVRPSGCAASAAGFGPTPLGHRCRTSTGRCPTLDMCEPGTAAVSNAGDRPSNAFAEDCTDHQMACSINSDGVATFSCLTCSGGFFTISNISAAASASSRACVKVYVAPDAPPHLSCTPAIDCSGNGCCLPVAQRTGNRLCECHGDDLRGHWAGATCASCAAEFDPTDRTCLTRLVTARIFLQQLGTNPLAMTMPVLFVMLLFVGFSVLRQRWPSDKEHVTMHRRRAGITTVGVPRPRDRAACVPGAAYIPSRPAGSRGMVNMREQLRQQLMRRGAAAAMAGPMLPLPGGGTAASSRHRVTSPHSPD